MNRENCGSPVIDWSFVFVHSLWILGAAVILAAFSYHDWLRREQARPLRAVWRQPEWRAPAHAGLLMIASSFVLMRGAAWWERLAWAALALVWARGAGRAWREIRGSAAAKPQHGPDRPDQDPQVEQQ